jgi:hypothetical protein
VTEAETIAAIPYIIVALLALRPAAGHFAWLMAEREWERGRLRWPTITPETQPPPDGEKWFGGMLLALATMSVWPLTLAWTLVGRRWTVGAERRGQLAQQRGAHRRARKGARPGMRYLDR